MILDVSRIALDIKLLLSGAGPKQCKEAYIEMNKKNHECTKAIINRDIAKWNKKLQKSIDNRDAKIKKLNDIHDKNIKNVKDAFMKKSKRAEDSITAIKEYETILDKNHKETIELLEREINSIGQPVVTAGSSS